MFPLRLRAMHTTSTDLPERGALAGAPSDHDCEAFLAAFPGYRATARIDLLRRTDYERLDRLGQVYLDYTGAGLYAASQVERHREFLLNRVLGNPHSENPTSLDASGLVAEARAAVLRHFNADPDEYGVIFTPNASGALKLVGESFPFGPGGRYLLTYDNHNSVNGIRQFARQRGATITYLPVMAPELRVDAGEVARELERTGSGAARLFAFPAQSNFSGVQHPLEWVSWARDRGWHVLLDSAAFSPTNRLDLAAVKPDFVPLSFYKMFGYPTGIGALVYRHDALRALTRPWFAGGTITLASVQSEDWHRLAEGHAGFEDGTVDFLGLPAVTIGFYHLASIGIDVIHERVMVLTGWVLAQFERARALGRRAGGARLRPDRPDEARRDDRVLPPGTGRYCTTCAPSRRTPSRGGPVDSNRVLLQSRRRRGGPRDLPRGHGEVLRADLGARDVRGLCGTLRAATGRPPNTMRVSFGIASNFADAAAIVALTERYRDVATAIGRPAGRSISPVVA